MRNLITDVPGLKVGHAEDIRLGSGSTAVIFEEPAVASIDLRGGGPGTRETALLDPAQTVEGIDAIALSGGSAFGLDAASGVQAWLREQGRGFAVRTARVPIVPAAILFDLLSGGNKDWGRYPPYREFGYAAAASAGVDFALGSVGAGTGATTVNCKGGIGSASAQSPEGFAVGALAAVNAAGSVSIGSGPWFWAAPFEQNGEYGGRGLPQPFPPQALRAAHQGRHAREHDARRRRHRRDIDQGAGQAPRRDGAIRPVARDLSGPQPARRRRLVRGLDRTPAACRPDAWPDRARRACRQCRGPRHRAGGLCGRRAALGRRDAKLAGSIRPLAQRLQRACEFLTLRRKPRLRFSTGGTLVFIDSSQDCAFTS